MAKKALRGSARVAAGRKNTSKKKKLNGGILSRFPKRALIFAGLFGVIGVGTLVASLAMSATLPTRADQIVFSYTNGRAHRIIPGQLPPTHNPTVLLYGNGRMLCNLHNTHNTATTSAPIKERTLTPQQISNYVSRIQGIGFEKLPDQTYANPQRRDPAAFANTLTLNSTEGSTSKMYFSGTKPAAFKSVEDYIKLECQQATKTYEPNSVIVKAVKKDVPVSAATTTVASNLLNTDSRKDGAARAKLLQGTQKQAILKSVQSNKAALTKVNNEVYETIVTPAVPAYQTPIPKKILKNKKATASAQAAQQTRWLYVIAADQSISTSAAQDQIDNVSGQVRSFFNNKSGRTVNFSQISVVKGKMTAAQYQVCPGGSCSYDWQDGKGPVLEPSLAVVKNMNAEFNQANVSTNIIYSFNLGKAGCIGWGSQPSDIGAGGTASVTTQGCNWAEGLYSVAAHEFGHTLSFAHVCENGNLMASCAGASSGSGWPGGYSLNSSQLAVLASSPFFSNKGAPPPPPPPPPPPATDTHLRVNISGYSGAVTMTSNIFSAAYGLRHSIGQCTNANFQFSVTDSITCDGHQIGPVTVTAPNIAGYTFSGWSGCPFGHSGLNCQVDQFTSGTKTITATYAQNNTNPPPPPPPPAIDTHLQVNVSGYSSAVTMTSNIFPSYSQRHSIGQCTNANYQFNVTSTVTCDGHKIGPVTVTAPAINGYTFNGWSGCPNGASGYNCHVGQFTSGTTAITATYTATGTPTSDTFLKVDVNGYSGAVTMTSNIFPGYGSRHSVGYCTNGYFQFNVTSTRTCDGQRIGPVTITAPAINGYTFNGWSGCPNGSSGYNCNVGQYLDGTRTISASYSAVTGPPPNQTDTYLQIDTAGLPSGRSVRIDSGPRAFGDPNEPAHDVGDCYRSFDVTASKTCNGFRMGPISMSAESIPGYTFRWWGCDATSPSGYSCWMGLYDNQLKRVSIQYYPQ